MEDRELQALVRRAKSISDKTSTSRRSALRQLVEATHSSNVSLKTFAAKNIPDFFQDFPEAEEDAINAVYDLCEDQVRMAGYNALVQMSRLEKKWVKRNADVLVQLLQSDDPNEVTMVRKALVDHLQFDARVTLGVLCDQVIPPDDLADLEELSMRDSLRTLVLSFITSELKKGQLVRYMPPGSEAEATLLDGLISAIPKLGESTAQLALKDILMQTQFLDIPCPRGSTLSQLVLQRAKKALSDDHLSPNAQNGSRPLNKTRPYFDILSVLFISKSQSKLEDLINFYTPILGKPVFSQISTEDQLTVLHHFAETLYASKANDPSVVRLLNLTPSFFEVRTMFLFSLLTLTLMTILMLKCLSKTNLSEVKSQETCRMLLQRILLAMGNGWTIPLPVLHSAQSLGRAVPSLGHGEDIHGLIRVRKGLYIFPCLFRSLTAPDLFFPVQSLATKRRDSSAKPSLKPRTLTSPPFPSTIASQDIAPPSLTSTISTSAVPSRLNLVPTSQGGKLLSRKQAPDSENSGNFSHPTKKVKKGGGELDSTPSLLSRMASSSSLTRTRTHSYPSQLHQSSRAQLRPQHSESLLEEGELVIKGAAKKEMSLSAGNETYHRAEPGQALTVDSSLIDRLTLNGGMVGINHAHARRNKRRGMA
ncbi:hypothetical protein F5050DRAFT_47190 [Lentinula boryana]|uniref:Apoptosis inhibitor 5 n=1 Tax=Lentinula boryana TaxID=40481 RepID=A0ABQ8QE04_9AGAR|nr:hypothetical protein F5050DRAFT_47190 [Lentinula boryana]